MLDHDLFQSVMSSYKDFKEKLGLISDMQQVYIYCGCFGVSLFCSCPLADGQGIAVRLSKQIHSCNRRLKNHIAAYNNINWPPQMSSCPPRVEFEEASDLSFPGYLCLDDDVRVFHIYRTFSEKQNIVQKLIFSRNIIQKAKLSYILDALCTQ